MAPATARKPLVFQLNSQNLAARISRPVVEALAEWAFQLPAINQVYRNAHDIHVEEGFVEKLLRSLDARYTVSDADLAQIPRSGPLIVVANHPFGGVDGLVLAALLRRVRSDVKLLANHLLGAIPELRDLFILVDAFVSPSRAAPSRNITAIRSAVRWIDAGGALAIFPAGEVSHLCVRQQAVRDNAWPEHVGRLASITGAPVLPVFFDGRNSNLFQLAGLVHPLLRTLLLPREMLRRRKQTVIAHIGSVISRSRLTSFQTDAQRAAYLHARTYILKGRIDSTVKRPGFDHAAISPPVAIDLLEQDLHRLRPEETLARHGDFSVHVARADCLPHILPEIGRLREMTFRAVGEGTGGNTDLDRFDKYYLHLFVWNKARREIAGAYRLGPTDEILPRFGVAGLYTSTLFRFGEKLMSQLEPALELGRSFVAPHYQREYAPLMLLWKGIGAFVAHNPRYRRMFGTVSISNDYASLSRQLLMTFLRLNRWLPGLARLVTPRNPPRFGPGRAWEATLASTVAQSIEDVDALVADIETERRGVPILLRQYLKLGAKLLGFNIDHDFADVLDGLILIDLMDVEPAVLNRYMGKEAARAFREYHNPVHQSDSISALGEA